MLRISLVQGEDLDLDADLTAVHDHEAALGTRRRVRGRRADLREDFIVAMGAEGRRSLIDVGAGPGLDAEVWAARGFDLVGLDLAPGNVAAMGERGVRGVCGSLYRPHSRTPSSTSCTR